jgi:hypothetical protein
MGMIAGVQNCFLQNFFQHIPLTVPNSSEAALGHIFSKQCKAKQLKRHQVIIDNCLKFSEKTRTFSFLTTQRMEKLT